MSGYTPLFGSLTTGTLYGRWPDIGLWPIVLALADKHGVVDVTPQYLSGVTGLPVDQLTACMQRFCEPDPYSRSPAEDGRRLVLLDPDHRKWGWKIVNHAQYREKARKAARDARRTESGEDASRKREERRSRRVPRCPAMSRDVPLSDANTSTDTNITKEKSLRSSPSEELPAGLDRDAWNRWEAYRRHIRKPLKAASVGAAQRKLADFGTDQAAVVEQSIANGWMGLFPLKDNGTAKGISPEPSSTWRPTDDDGEVSP